MGIDVCEMDLPLETAIAESVIGQRQYLRQRGRGLAPRSSLSWVEVRFPTLSEEIATLCLG